MSPNLPSLGYGRDIHRTDLLTFVEKVKEVINLRYRFLLYLYMLAIEAHKKGHPIVRPLFYEFQQDENTYKIEDEYMVGKSLVYAPILQGEKRKVYLQKEAQWADFWDGEVIRGWVDSRHELPKKGFNNTFISWFMVMVGKNFHLTSFNLSQSEVSIS